MTGENKCWVERKDKTVEGHTSSAALYFKDQEKPLWGPKSCHQNAYDIKTALHKADSRLELRMDPWDHSVEGHTRTFNIRANGVDLLRNLSCHDNMDSLATIINTIWTVDPPN